MIIMNETFMKNKNKLGSSGIGGQAVIEGNYDEK